VCEETDVELRVKVGENLKLAGESTLVGQPFRGAGDHSSRQQLGSDRKVTLAREGSTPSPEEASGPENRHPVVDLALGQGRTRAAGVDRF